VRKSGGCRSTGRSLRVEPLSLRQPLTETCAVAARAADSCSEAYTPTPSLIQIMREELRVRMPDLANAPLLEARLCQFEDTPEKDLLIDRHPEAANVWFVGGGSDLGFKLAPALGEYVAQLVLGRQQPKARFQLSRSSVIKTGSF
jgi:glycine/D-amino acid oxidase-like deaminating enzyme